VNEYRRDGRVRLFEGSGGYGDGEQRRDFIHVDDVVAVNLHFHDHPARSGIFNVGTGTASTFNAVAQAAVNACRRAEGESPRPLQDLVAAGIVAYVPMPEALHGKYQNFTQGDIAALRSAGFNAPMLDVEQGVAHYVESLISP